ncbi:uncharacterized protein LOC135820684 [Sycon ciliatum]|uniref:uncharacterized protein LOC135820684 n=1 Tax=Sycon ciliatum TaxID=27933 RepID=UPI0031F66443
MPVTPSAGSVPIGYQITYYPRVKESKARSQFTALSAISIANLSAGTMYLMNISAVYPTGQSRPATVNGTTDSAPAGSGGSFSYDIIIISLCGLLAVFVIALLVCCAWRKHKTKQNNYNLEQSRDLDNNSGNQPSTDSVRCLATRPLPPEPDPSSMANINFSDKDRVSELMARPVPSVPQINSTDTAALVDNVVVGDDADEGYEDIDGHVYEYL